MIDKNDIFSELDENKQPSNVDVNDIQPKNEDIIVETTEEKAVLSEEGGRIVEAKPYQKRDETDKSVFFERPNVETEYGVNNSNPQTGACCKKRPKDRFSKAVSIVLSAIILVLVFVFGYTSSSLFNSSDSAVASWMADQINEKAYFAEEEVTPFDIMKYGIGGIMNDPYSAMFYPSEMEAMYREYEGTSKSIGMTVTQYTDMAGVYVAGTIKGSPADEAGLQAGWRIISINGVDVLDTTIVDLTAIIKGIPDDTKFPAVFATPDPNGNYDLERTIDVELQRTTFTPVVVEYFDNSSNGLNDLLDDDTAYIILSSFVGDVEKQFDAAMKLFKENGKTNLILDLRNNGGGSDYNLQGVAKHLVTDEKDSNNVLILKEQYKDGSERLLATEDNLYDDYDFGEIIVLVNENSASASEALLLAMIDYETVDLVIGMTTYGKGTGLTTITMPATNYGIRFTASYFFSPFGNSNEKIGIEPTAGYKMEDKRTSPYIYYTDEIFMRALASLM